MRRCVSPLDFGIDSLLAGGVSNMGKVFHRVHIKKLHYYSEKLQSYSEKLQSYSEKLQSYRSAQQQRHLSEQTSYGFN